ncbi:AI-2E family transporter [Silvimonas sp. JCM 19000]
MFGFDVRTARIVWTILLIALLVYIVYAVSTTLLVVVFAVFFSYLIYPLIDLVDRIRPDRVPRTVSIAVVFAAVISIIATLGAVFGTQIQDEAVHLSQQLPGLLNSNHIFERIPLPDFLKPVRGRIFAFIQSHITEGGDNVSTAKQFGIGVMHVASNLIYLVLVPILSFLLIKEGPDIRNTVLLWLDRKQRKLWAGIIEDLDVLLSRYVRALLLLAIATCISYSIGYSLLGVPYALLLASAAAMLEFIPFAGPLAAAGLAIVVAGFSGYAHMWWLIVFIGCYRMFQDYVLNPFLMSEGVEVSPLMVIIGLLAGDQLGGVAGIFLSVPLMAALKIIFIRASAAQKTRLEVMRKKDEEALARATLPAELPPDLPAELKDDMRDVEAPVPSPLRQ